jgi:hypothetical protein
MNPQNFWNKYEFSVGQIMLFKAGYVEVFVKHISNGWLIKGRATEEPYTELQVEGVEEISDDSDVFHFQTGKSHVLHVVPALPNKAVVFRNNKNIKVSAGQLANLFFRIPLNIQFYFQEVKEENRMLGGGPMWYGDSIGLDKVVAKLKQYDPSEAISPLLEKLAKEGKKFQQM